MYCAHFGLEILPFKISPDPGFLYETSQNRRALSLLRSGFAQFGPISVVSGDVGTGKTTLVLKALRDAPESVTLGLLSIYPGWADDILPWVLGRYDIPDGSDDVQRMTAFSEFVRREHDAGRLCVLIVDEAQNVSHQALEQLRRLADVNDAQQICFALILVGQTELDQRLKKPECAALARRVGVSIKLGPMNAAETDAYIRHRLTVAGGRPDIFDQEAIAAIHDLSGGVPRLVNLLCDTAMVLAYGAGEHRIGRNGIRRIGEQGSVLAHLPKVVERARNVPPGSSAVQADPISKAIPEESKGDLQSEDNEMREQDVKTQEIATSRAFSKDWRDADKAEMTTPPACRSSSQKASAIRHGTDSKRLRVRFGVRFVFGGAVAASALAAGSVFLTPTAIHNVAPVQQEDLASLRPLLAATPGLSRITAAPLAESKPLTDMSGEAFLDRALSAGLADPRAAAIDYARAALRGEHRAAYYLGQLYETGDGVPRDLAQARAWYRSVEETVRGARRRLKDLEPLDRSGDLTAPIPLLGGTLDSGGAEFVWSSGAGMDPGYFVVELTRGPRHMTRQLPPQERSALKVDSVGDARLWRVISVGPKSDRYAASDWFPLGQNEPAASSGSEAVAPHAVIQLMDDKHPEWLDAVMEILDASRIPYSVETGAAKQTVGSGVQVGYFFENDADSARAIADIITAEAIHADVQDDHGTPKPIPGQVLISVARD